MLYLAGRPWLLAKSFLAMFVLMPIAVVAMVRILDLHHALEVSLVALAISPVTPLLPRKLTKVGGREEYDHALGLLAIMSLLAVVVIPLAASLLGRIFGRSVVMNPVTIARIVIVAAILPLLAGMAVRRFRPALAASIGKPVNVIAVGLLAAALLVLIGGTWATLWQLATGRTLAAMVAFVVFGRVIGHLLGGSPRHRVALALSTATRHPAIALGIAQANFPYERFGGTILLYLLVSAIVAIPHIRSQPTA